MSVDKRVVLITGASSGIGLATATLLAKQGYVTYGTYHHSALQESHPEVHFLPLDLEDSLAIRKTIQEVIQKEGKIDILVNNGGYGLMGALESLTVEEMKQQLQVGFIAAVVACQEVLPAMRKQRWGRILNISSVQGIFGFPYGALYCATKAALEMASEALSLEVAPWNIFVSLIEPWHVATKFKVLMGSRLVQGEDPYKEAHQIIHQQQEAKNRNITSVGEYQTPEEIAIFIHNVIEEETPLLRYQTSEKAEEIVAMKIHDLDGFLFQGRIKDLLIESGMQK